MASSSEMRRSVIEDRLITVVAAAMPLPDMALEAVVAGIPLFEGSGRSTGEPAVDLVWIEQDPGLL
ncbi:hypothetical protein [Rhodococcus artemisiae]|uniref:Uncharacterized protein n=1 Tax=Rhodococcus artemisiae TaxID=714159 RepID=A0ABU7LJ66_9NOCA|nr:hypothetical protein [Rhodococcus artemisiae]MEE2061541.1 hypothetical protein [Rhodococcus artemisiae]